MYMYIEKLVRVDIKVNDGQNIVKKTDNVP